MAAALRHLVLLVDDILETFPPGVTPPIENVTLFRNDEIEGYLKEPSAPDYRKPVPYLAALHPVSRGGKVEREPCAQRELFSMLARRLA